MVVHGHIYVNGKRLDRPGYLVRQGDRISVKPADRSRNIVRQNIQSLGGATPQPWLQLNAEQLEATVVSLPTRDDVQIPVEEQLIVEVCSR